VAGRRLKLPEWPDDRESPEVPEPAHRRPRRSRCPDRRLGGAVRPPPLQVAFRATSSTTRSLLSRLDAERIARGVAEKSAGDPYIVKLKQTEIDRFRPPGARRAADPDRGADRRCPEAGGHLLLRLDAQGAGGLAVGVEGGPLNVEPGSCRFPAPIPWRHPSRTPTTSRCRSGSSRCCGSASRGRAGQAGGETAERALPSDARGGRRVAPRHRGGVGGRGDPLRRTRRAEDARVEASGARSWRGGRGPRARDPQSPERHEPKLELLEEQPTRSVEGSRRVRPGAAGATSRWPLRQETGRSGEAYSPTSSPMRGVAHQRPSRRT